MTIKVIGTEFVDTTIQILKEATCPSLSGRSTLTYQQGRTPEADILFRILKNSATGKFNSQWVSLTKIRPLLEATTEPFSWSVLFPLFSKQSVNSAGFLLAILVQEGLVTHEDGKYRMAPQDVAITQQASPKSRRAKA